MTRSSELCKDLRHAISDSPRRSARVLLWWRSVAVRAFAQSVNRWCRSESKTCAKRCDTSRVSPRDSSTLLSQLLSWRAEHEWQLFLLSAWGPHWGAHALANLADWWRGFLGGWCRHRRRRRAARLMVAWYQERLFLFCFRLWTAEIGQLSCVVRWLGCDEGMFNLVLVWKFDALSHASSIFHMVILKSVLELIRGTDDLYPQTTGVTPPRKNKYYIFKQPFLHEKLAMFFQIL